MLAARQQEVSNALGAAVRDSDAAAALKLILMSQRFMKVICDLETHVRYLCTALL